MSFDPITYAAVQRLINLTSTGAASDAGSRLMAVLLASDVTTEALDAFLSSAEGPLALDDVVHSPLAMQRLCGSSSARAALLGSTQAKAAMFSASVAMNAIINDAGALASVFGDASAKAAFKASSVLTAATVPTLSGSTGSDGGVVLVSATLDSSHNGYCAFDDLGGTSWQSPGYATLSAGMYVGYCFPVPVFIHTAVVLPVASIGPNSIRIQCSENGSTWVDAASGACDSSATYYYFDVSAAGRYRYWRLYVVSGWQTYGVAVNKLQFNGFK